MKVCKRYSVKSRSIIQRFFFSLYKSDGSLKIRSKYIDTIDNFFVLVVLGARSFRILKINEHTGIMYLSTFYILFNIIVILEYALHLYCIVAIVKNICVFGEKWFCDLSLLECHSHSHSFIIFFLIFLNDLVKFHKAVRFLNNYCCKLVK